MPKLDITKQHKAYYTAARKPEIVHHEAATYLSITGQGDPSSDAFTTALQALYGVAYTLKVMCKGRSKDFGIAKLEGLWSFDEAQYGHLSMSDIPAKVPRNEWHYRILIRMPDFITAGLVALAREHVAAQKQLPEALEVALYSLPTRKTVQILHTGPFETESETLQQMHAFMATHQLKRSGPHHEIYLSDFRKTAPGKLKTILREPVA